MRHVGFQLNENNPCDKKVKDILESLSYDQKKTAYIKRAIIFYHDYMGNDGFADQNPLNSGETIFDVIISRLNALDKRISLMDADTSDKMMKKNRKPEKQKKEVIENQVLSDPDPEPTESLNNSRDEIIINEDTDVDMNKEEFDSIMADFFKSSNS